MVTENLGYQIDINCGGIDNIYRHHDYNIAVIESISGKEYANFYLHGEHLIVDGKTMSKSRGNIHYPADVLGRNFKPYHLRFFLIYSHYRRRLNLTDEKLQRAVEYVDSARDLIQRLLGQTRENSAADVRQQDADRIITAIRQEFEKHMNDDLSVGRAVDGVYKKLRTLNDRCFPLQQEAAQRLGGELSRIDTVLQVWL
jgi:cysteinyl-tRNA synthetase